MSFGDGRRAWGTVGAGYQTRQDGDTEYLRLNDDIASNIMKIQKNTETITKISGMIGTNKDTSESRDRLHDVLESTRKLAKDTGEDIKKMANLDGGTQADNRQRKQQQQKLNQQFIQTWQKFSDVAKTVMEKERATVSLARKSSLSVRDDNPLLKNKGRQPDDDEENQAFLAEDNVKKQRQQQVLQNELEYNENIIAEREEGIREIESTINEVNTIFRDLAELVNEQGEMIDNIENNISQTVVRTDQANQELTKASKYQKSARTKMCCLLLIILIVAAILTVIFIPKN